MKQVIHLMLRIISCLGLFVLVILGFKIQDKYGQCLCLAVDLICLKARLGDSGEKEGGGEGVFKCE